jgi:hypothetical protein
MIVRIDTLHAPAVISLQEPTTFTGFHIAFAGADEAGLAAAVARIGSMADADHVYVDRAALEGLAGDHAQDPDWQRSLEAMLQYATSKGWVDDTGAIRAHIERADV